MSNTIKNIKQMQALLVISIFLGEIGGFFIVNMVHYFAEDYQLAVTMSKIVFLILIFSIFCILTFCFINLDHIKNQLKETEQTKDKTVPGVENNLEEQTKDQDNKNTIDSDEAGKNE